ncbi:C40 family peptidase [Levilactobacillus zymae]|uniref:L-alanyl-gamma-D-glutamyl-L-diamino acid endopeptidase n=1 Tax=Levilactobacillus zymae TaxID=267363 RepID=A0A1Y6JTY2_9LACO|nr:NlpC/P60 family protein [Levilactobacillus zymae]SMS13388.1 L-alanyl-gamma-D-glutamyl-L-diamino acid endopeptidase [Levilactobacillus zymae]
MKIKQLSLTVATAAAFLPVWGLTTTASANTTNTINSTSSMPDTQYVRKSATGWTYNLGGTASNMTFGKKTHYLKNYPNTTWHATQKRYITKKNGVKYLYYYVTNGKKTASGWIWHGYLQKKSYSHTTSTTSTKGTGTYASVLKAAQAQLGKPYVYGGNGPSSFDCSGFTKYVFKQAIGQTLPRTAQAQYNAYDHVSASNAKPGDLIFFGTSTSNITHCGIYLGNHKMIDAQLRGVVTEATNVSWWHTVGYARPATLS